MRWEGGDGSPLRELCSGHHPRRDGSAQRTCIDERDRRVMPWTLAQTSAGGMRMTAATGCEACLGLGVRLL